MAAWISSRLCVPSQNGRLEVCLQLHNQYSLSSVTVNFIGRNFMFKYGFLWVPSHKGWNNEEEILHEYHTWTLNTQYSDWLFGYLKTILHVQRYTQYTLPVLREHLRVPGRIKAKQYVSIRSVILWAGIQFRVSQNRSSNHDTMTFVSQWFGKQIPTATDTMVKVKALPWTDKGKVKENLVYS